WTGKTASARAIQEKRETVFRPELRKNKEIDRFTETVKRSSTVVAKSIERSAADALGRTEDRTSPRHRGGAARHPGAEDRAGRGRGAAGKGAGEGRPAGDRDHAAHPGRARRDPRR